MNRYINEINNIDCCELLVNLPDESIDLICTDPPYNLGYSGRGKENVFDNFANDQLTEEAHTEWFDGVLKEFERVLKTDSAVYIFIDFRNYARIYGLVKKYFDIKNCIVWDKTYFGLGQHYRFQHEFIIYATKGKHKLNLEKRNVSDIWQCKRLASNKYVHPTQKPIELIYKILEYSSKEGDVVLDPFAGGYTIPVACMEMERNFIATELDKNYCDIGEKRLKEAEK